MKKKLLLFFAMLLGVGAASQAQVVLSEGFNVTASTNTPPSGWTLNSNGSTSGCYGIDWEQLPSGGFICTNNGAPQPTPTAQAGSGMAGYNSWDISGGSWSDLISPSLNFSGLGTYTVSFYVHEQQAFYGDDSLRVLINTSPTSSGATLLGAYVPNYNPPNAYGWAQYTLSIPTTFNGANNYIIFRAVSDYGYDIFIDEVVVTRIPPTPCSGTPSSPSIANATMTTPLCTGTSYTINAVDPNLPATSGITYQWETASSATGPWSPVSGGSGGTSLSYTTPTLTTSAWYRMALTCAASSTTIYTPNYLVQVGAPQPGPITGPGTFCPGDPETFSVTAAASTTYNWTLPSGWTGTSTTNSITATPAGSGGLPVTVSVTATDACGTSIPRTLVLNPGSAPSAPTGISGATHFCSNTPQTYSVTPVGGALYYVWTLPSGWSGTSTTNTINVTNTISSGTISVSAVNGCGNSPATTLAVTSISSLGSIGTIYGPDSVCGSALATYYIHPLPGATSYVWTLPSGWSGTTTDTLVQVFGGTASGTITVTAYVSCATSAPTSKSLVLVPQVVPTVTLSVPPGSICEGSAVTVTATYTGGGTAPSFQWYKNSTAISASGATYNTNTLHPGDALQVTMTSNAACASPTTANSNVLMPTVVPATVSGVNINSTPGEAFCTGTMVQFSSNSTGTGTNPKYQWQVNGVDVQNETNPTFMTSGLSDNDSVSLLLFPSGSCAPAGGVESNKIGVIIRDTLVPDATVSVSPGNVITPGDEVTFTATPVNGGATPTFQWIRNGVNIPFATGSTYTTSSLKPGDEITVSMVSYLSCAYPRFAVSSPIRMEGYDLSVGKQPGAGSIAVYPNPSKGQLRIKADLSGMRTGGIRAEIMNAIGQVVHRVEFIGATGNAWEGTIELPAALANGQYILHIRNAATDGDPLQVVRQFQLIR